VQPNKKCQKRLRESLEQMYGGGEVTDGKAEVSFYMACLYSY
jgi:hypothetical protein